MPKTRLTCTITKRTLNTGERTVDPTAKKLVSKLQLLRRQNADIENQIRSIQMALGVAEITNYGDPYFIKAELRYADKRPFSSMPLSESCLKVLEDLDGEWATKHQVEYLLVIGGYESDAKDVTNSVEVTLRRLGDDGKCEVERVRGGSHGNRYRRYRPGERHKGALKDDSIDSSDTGATKT